MACTLALVAVALSATSLGLVVPVMKDAGVADRRLGQLVIAAASVADFGAVLSLLFSMTAQPAGTKLILLGGFAFGRRSSRCAVASRPVHEVRGGAGQAAGIHRGARPPPRRLPRLRCPPPEHGAGRHPPRRGRPPQTLDALVRAFRAWVR
ncbi:MAG: cation:proton antiporter [Egibacteraceae bacterium]